MRYERGSAWWLSVNGGSVSRQQQQQLLFEKYAQRTALLSNLSRRAQGAFGMSCCQRMSENISACYAQIGREELIPQLRKLVSFLWKALETRGDELLLPRDAKRCDDTITEAYEELDPEAPLYALAEDGLSALKYIVQHLAQIDSAPSVQLVVKIGDWAIESVREWIGLTSDYDPLIRNSDSQKARSLGISTDLIVHDRRPDDDLEWMRNHPMVVAECSKQLFDLDVLQVYTDFGDDLLTFLRESSGGLGVQPFLRGLLEPKKSARRKS
jgi:hypothetical protein